LSIFNPIKTHYYEANGCVAINFCKIARIHRFESRKQEMLETIEKTYRSLNWGCNKCIDLLQFLYIFIWGIIKNKQSFYFRTIHTYCILKYILKNDRKLSILKIFSYKFLYIIINELFIIKSLKSRINFIFYLSYCHENIFLFFKLTLLYIYINF